jgi:hypothetical protein
MAIATAMGRLRARGGDQRARSRLLISVGGWWRSLEGMARFVDGDCLWMVTHIPYVYWRYMISGYQDEWMDGWQHKRRNHIKRSLLSLYRSGTRWTTGESKPPDIPTPCTLLEVWFGSSKGMGRANVVVRIIDAALR